MAKITIYTNGDDCGCESNINECTPCGQTEQAVQTLPASTLPCSNGSECKESTTTDCVLLPIDIPEWGIKKGDKLTKLLTTILSTLTPPA